MKYLMRFIFVLCFFLINKSIYSQNIFKNDSLPIFEINNNEFKVILDSFIMHEQLYDYYDSTAMFTVTIKSFSDSTSIQLFSGGKANFNILEENENKQFFFIHNNHYFLVTNRSIYFDKKLFKSTNTKHVVHRVTIPDKSNFDKTRNTIIIDSKLDNDNSWGTTWIYLFANNKFIEIYKIPRSHGKLY